MPESAGSSSNRFWTRYKNGSQAVRNDILSFAIAKLSSGKREKAKPVDGIERADKALLSSGQQALFAALGVRLLFDINPALSLARRMEEYLVERCMRVVYTVPEHREYLRTGYPSEPLLAEAAAQMMHTKPKYTEQEIFDAVALFSSAGIVDKGESGELAMRLLLTLAYDRAIQDTADAVLEPSGDLLYSQGVKVVPFLQQLFRGCPKELQSFLESTPHNLFKTSQPNNATTLQEMFNNSCVRFTHWARYSLSHIHDKSACEAFGRGLAMQVTHNQAGIDCAIPILLDSSKKLGLDNMAVILIQCRNRIDKRGSAVIDATTTTPPFFTHSLEANLQGRLPYISVFMELGIKTESEGLEVLLGPSRRTLGRDDKFEPTRYAIKATGVRPYGVDTGAMEAILHNRTVIDEHPRQHPDNLAAVRRLCFEMSEDAAWYSHTT